ncbi:hypothetical protein [Streptomyces sp. NPDC045251]|uniref:hypothetical protein n=1 Tax=unclassified Streptomyces TaxID=2593676 RepID=UPI0033C2D534
MRAQLKKAERNRKNASRPQPAPLDAMPEEENLEHLRTLDGFAPASEALPDLIKLPEPDAALTRPLAPRATPPSTPPAQSEEQP